MKLNLFLVLFLAIVGLASCDCDHEYDCAEIEANIGDPCTISQDDSTTVYGLVSDSCTCVDPIPYDCPDQKAFIGQLCVVSDSDIDSLVVYGKISEDCECVAFDCPELNANVGDPCWLGFENGFGVLNEDCECRGLE